MIDYNLYQTAFKDVSRINKIDPAEPELRLCKVYEEMGELTQAVNKTLGRKVIKESKEEVMDNILEELADTFQCVYSWWDTLDSNAVKSNEKVLNSTSVPVRHSDSIQETVIFAYQAIVKATEAREVNYFNISNIYTRLLKLAQCFEIHFDDINKMVLTKNKKWESVVEARKKEGKPALWPFS